MAEESPNRFEVQGRYDKAWRLYRRLKYLGVSSETAAEYADWQWDMHSSYLGMKKPPSEKTQGLVIGFLMNKKA